ncbi:MAG: pilus assembly protein PilM [Acidobacteria bacterium]|nr:pilus assembly protein PilM [Acidobacteriota bacterium]
MSLLDWLAAAPPDVAVAIDRGHVSAARLDWRGGRPVVAAEACEALPAGTVTPALAVANMPDTGAVGVVVSRVLGELGGRASRVALVVPDPVVKVSLIRLEKVPQRAADLREIVRWQVKKSSPFPVEQAVLSISPGEDLPDGGREFVVALAREDVIRQYEQACAMARAHAGVVDLATFGVVSSILTGGVPSGDWLVVHVAESFTTVAVMRGERLIFFRTRSDESEGTLGDLIHQTAMYYEDRLQGTGLSHVWLAGPGAMTTEAQRDVEARLNTRVEAIPAGPLAPLIGVLARDGKAA